MSAHPHFNDQGAVQWFLSYEEALAEAKRSGKRLFIESGRKACGNCRVLVESVLPRDEVKRLLAEHFVCYADDCDQMAPEVLDLGREHLRHASTLPFVIVTDAEGVWLGGSSGQAIARPDALLALLRAALPG
jgi:Thioredoxin-like